MVQRSNVEIDEWADGAEDCAGGTGTTEVEFVRGEDATVCADDGEFRAWDCDSLLGLEVDAIGSSRVHAKLNIQTNEAANAPEQTPVAKPTQRVGAFRIEGKPWDSEGPIAAASASTSSNESEHGIGRTARNRFSKSVHCGSHDG